MNVADKSKPLAPGWPLDRAHERWDKRNGFGWLNWGTRSLFGPLTLPLDAFLLRFHDQDRGPRGNRPESRGEPEHEGTVQGSKLFIQFCVIVVSAFGGATAGMILSTSIFEKLVGILAFAVFGIVLILVLAQYIREDKRMKTDPWGPLTPPSVARQNLPNWWRRGPTTSWPQAAALGVQSAQPQRAHRVRMRDLWRAQRWSAAFSVVLQPLLVAFFALPLGLWSSPSLWLPVIALTLVNVMAVSLGLHRWFVIGRIEAAVFRTRAARVRTQDDPSDFEEEVRDAFHRVNSRLARMEAMLRDRGTSI